MRHPQFLPILISAFCVSFTPNQLFGADAPVRYVVGHWLLPMNYGPSAQDRGKDDVRAAMEEGLDGFAFDVFSGPDAIHTIGAFIQAADAIGATKFKVALSADMSYKLGGRPRFSAADIISVITMFGDNPHYLRLNGKPLLSTYGGEDLGIAWWSENVLKPLNAAGHPVTFVPYFDRPRQNYTIPNMDNWTKHVRSLRLPATSSSSAVAEAESPGIDGIFDFDLAGSTPFYVSDPRIGHHWWSFLEGEENLAQALHQEGKIFIAPYLPYYWAVCHSARQYKEFQGGRGMDNIWTSIITKQKPEAVEIVTWNDYTESSFIQPTRNPPTKTNGIPSYSHIGYYELLKYYFRWYHTGERPSITKDAVFYFYRPSIRGDSPPSADAFCSMGPVRANQLWGTVENVMYVTTALTSAAELRVKTGTEVKKFSVEPGLITTDVPFTLGPQVLELWRNGKKLLSSQGMDISVNPSGDNFNVFSAYAVSDGTSSETWQPSDAWKKGLTATWFSGPK